jgi:hypothetical protein
VTEVDAEAHREELLVNVPEGLALRERVTVTEAEVHSDGGKKVNEPVELEDPVVEGESSDDGDALAQPLVVPDAVALPELDDEPVLEGVTVDDRVAVDVAMAVKVPNDVRDDVPVVAPVLLVSAVFE